MIVYFDMDGVLTDFNMSVTLESGGTPRRDMSDVQFAAFMQDNAPRNFFAHLLPSPFLYEMEILMMQCVEAGHSVEILTSYGGWTSDFDVNVHRCKVHWLQTHLSDNTLSLIEKFNGVPMCTDKKKYASPTSLLLDDQIENCIQFEEEGGLAVHYSLEGHMEAFRRMKSILGMII